MDTQLPTGLMSAAKDLGLLRLMSAVAYANDASQNYTDHAREQMLTNRNSYSRTYLNEMGNIKSDFERALGTGFPKEPPPLLFVVAKNEKTPEWLELHHLQAVSITDGTVVPLAGEHYLHYTHAGDCGWG
ncbi:hypothetical protein LFT48_16085 [Arthrobacter sp. FW305-123]|nr:hypothetical protein LFT48_16085 [Arthrobacter sp. FW305-123]